MWMAPAPTVGERASQAATRLRDSCATLVSARPSKVIPDVQRVSVNEWMAGTLERDGASTDVQLSGHLLVALPPRLSKGGRALAFGTFVEATISAVRPVQRNLRDSPESLSARPVSLSAVLLIITLLRQLHVAQM